MMGMTREQNKLGFRELAPVWGWYLPGSLCLALLSPVDILTSNPWLAYLVDSVARHIPTIGSLSAVSSFPEVTRLVGVYLWLGFPVILVQGYSIARPMTGNWPWKVWLLALVGAPAALAVLYHLTFFMSASPPMEHVIHPVGRGRAGLAFISRNRIGLGLGAIPMIVLAISTAGWIKALYQRIRRT
ncbi:MAG: hypothetical protein B7Y41_11230 [Hydrogenophilales bacterium 28-61-23]|nr:MAG: hypothetical protein B7Y41_11230 [Hydrogenophilales bacterium 28-61-23]